jgi:allophanate hydrolase
LRPFLEAGNMLYGSACVAERLLSGRALLDRGGDALLSVIRDILSDATRYDALDAFRAIYRLGELRQSVEPMWHTIDALVLPTSPTIYRVDEVLANPREYNSNLGIYSTFANLMDLAAISVPNGFRADGVPSGITLFGPRASEPVLVAAGAAYHRAVGGTVGATDHELAGVEAAAPASEPALLRDESDPRYGDRRSIVVVGAHLHGEPLNHQLVGLGGTLVSAGMTAPRYRLYALSGTVPPKPGLERVGEGGVAVEVEVWSLDVRAFGAFVSKVPRPMCIGSIELASGHFVHGFLCEREALAEALDISHYGGWRAYLRAKASQT